jgi:DNA gyrase/topoisomerase IV subunit B
MSDDKEKIKKLSLKESVRLRAGMYIGDTETEKGMHALVFSALNHSLQLALNEYCTEICIQLNIDDEVIITNNCDRLKLFNKKDGKIWLKRLFTISDNDDYYNYFNFKVIGRMNGAGLYIVNFLSDNLIVDNYYGGIHCRLKAKNGVVAYCKKLVRKDKKSGLSIAFKPDRAIFSSDLHFSEKIITERLHEIAYMFPKVKFHWKNSLTNEHKVFHYNNGIKDWLMDINKKRKSLYQIVYKYGERISGRDINGKVETEIAFQYNSDNRTSLLCYSNGVNNEVESDQMIGFFAGLIAGFADFSSLNVSCQDNWNRITEEDIRNTLYYGGWSWDRYSGESYTDGIGEDISKKIIKSFKQGLSVIVSVWVSDWYSSNSIASALMNPYARELTRDVTYAAVRQFCEDNPDSAKQLIERFKSNCK